MKQLNRPKVQKEYRRILNKYQFLNSTLDVYSICVFNELIESLANQILSFNDNGCKEMVSIKIEWLIATIQKDQQMTLNLIVKKVMVVFMMIRRLIKEEIINEAIQEMFQKLINQILKQDIPKLMNPKQKRQSSINKIYNYIRDLSGSKEKHILSGKTIIQGQSNKGTLKEIVNHIIEPFCIYMLKILQNRHFYFTLFRPKTFVRTAQGLPWKVINYSKILGEIVYQLYRLGRYFVQDLTAICVYMILLCSKDIALYYDILKDCAEIKISQMKEIIDEGKNINNECSRVGLRQVTQLKEFVVQVMGIKQKIHYIFGNKNCKDFRTYFSKPNHYNLMDEKNNEPFQFILQYHSKMEKMEHKVKSLKKISKDSESLLFAQSIFSQQITTAPQIDSPPAKILDIYSGCENDYRLVETVKTKSRMNSWLNRSEKSKPFNAMHKDEDVVSTKGSS